MDRMYKWFIEISFKNGTNQKGYVNLECESSNDVIKRLFEGIATSFNTIMKDDNTCLGYCIGDVSWYTLSTKTL